ncbi:MULTISPECIES: sigma-54-dependent transcriptional regulator [Psychrobacter]|jgi:two-component system response regulator PilR (NtrC family)|uniref:sigma-54-dependent transcriptional regulator n=1 Tax=Psychrobacter TaxID=497 RepID=UPI000C34CDE1|nr:MULTISPECIES: sigma-54 dependent transcriptional regulator [Psychrobacter]MBA6244473.1 sigma-54-dependent Fis family transcriptional regulator [Psychrobacter sp. Urea-trap-18]MBA6287027.1 sigma-54-dependent Fis family transcriptional regulator [Psychrobacter sp. Urea-trap-16]MBA6319270.1 sigma-54-dependent Fis family transcriptional regulator [Psychrobacter sp. Urea-trap-20]MBA6335554.1 sigma-54-dependent Fis family transcriptional regulator [Psychrobacter sp. Urea-trap-19]PKG59401.1 sigma-
MTTTALVVDDEVDLCRLMQITLTKMGIRSDVAYTLSQARTFWQDNDYDFCLTDLKLPDGSGLELVREISNSSNIPIAVITAHGSMDLAIEALKLGAFDFVNKPLELPRLRQLVENALKVIHQDNEVQAAPEYSPEQKMLDSRLIGNSAVMHPLKNTILKLARSQAPVFLSGASGTGKEVVARLIHDLSPRRDGSFVPVNCGAIPSELMESEFFGHKKGSFTGAVADKQGLFQQANGGTLFLDEVADLPLAMQVKLLRAIQEKTVRAIGDTKEVPVDIRILSATHKDLSQLVQDGAFRQDLYYRINVIELKLPTLNARRDDIPVLADHFLAMIADDWQLESPPSLTMEACERLQRHDFAGNVRELRNLLERAVTLAETSYIDVSHLGLPDIEPELVNTQEQNHSSAIDSSELPARNVENQIDVQSTKDDEQVIQSSRNIVTQVEQRATNLHPYRTNTNHYPSMVQHSSASNDSSSTNVASTYDKESLLDSTAQQETSKDISGLQELFDGQLPPQGLEHYLQEQEKQLIITALKQTGWNKTQAAELLGTTFRSLRYRMKKLEISEDASD